MQSWQSGRTWQQWVRRRGAQAGRVVVRRRGRAPRPGRRGRITLCWS